MTKRILGILSTFVLLGLAFPASARIGGVPEVSSDPTVHEIEIQPGEVLEAPAQGPDGRIVIVRIRAKQCKQKASY